MGCPSPGQPQTVDQAPIFGAFILRPKCIREASLYSCQRRI